MRLAKSEELPGESTVEAIGAASRCPSRLGVSATSFRKLPEGGGGLRAREEEEEGKAAAEAAQAIAGIVNGFESSERLRRESRGCCGRGLPASHARCHRCEGVLLGR